MKNINPTMMQYFEWYTKPEDNLWCKVTHDASYLSSIGITHIWLPPAYKGSSGQNDTGYGVYDMYDLGEFMQKGSVRTKYGTKDEYLTAIQTLHDYDIQVLADVVLNHRLGADELENVLAIEKDPKERNHSLAFPKVIQAWTKYNFTARKDAYSSFKWNWTHFHGVDYDEKEKKNSIYLFYGKHWDEDVDKENGNFDYLMGEDIDFSNPEVVKEIFTWAKWYLETTHVDGFRMDAIKHIKASFMKDFITSLRKDTKQELFSIGEYWSSHVESLKNYLEEVDSSLSLFDVPLHYNFYQASNNNGNYDMRNIFNGTLVSCQPEKAITFVDNHDTEVGQSLQSWVQDWFKPLAYSLILFRNVGFPCIFYGDYYGISEKNVPSMKSWLDKFVLARKFFAYGEEKDYFDDYNILGFTRSGDSEHPDSGMAVILSDGPGGSKMMNVGKYLSNCILYDITGNLKETVYVDKEGNGIFYTAGGSVSIWVKANNIYKNHF